MYDDAAFQATNKSILGQIGQPPPAGVLVGLVETLGGAPDVVAATVEWGEKLTVWDVYGARNDVFAHVRGRRKMDDWYGGRGDADEVETQISTTARKISNLRSVGAEDVSPIKPIQGWVRACKATWLLTFDDVTIKLDERGRYGAPLGALALHVRDRYLGADSREGTSSTGE